MGFITRCHSHRGSSDAAETGASDDLTVRVANGLTDDQQVVGAAPTRRGGLRREQRDDVGRLAIRLGEVLHLPVDRPVDGDDHPVELDGRLRHLGGGGPGHQPRGGQFGDLAEGRRPPAAEADGAGDVAGLVFGEDDKGVRGGVDDGHF